MTISLQDQIREVGRELGMRRGTYPKWVKAHRMTQEEADQRITTMAAVYETLKRLNADPTAAHNVYAAAHKAIEDYDRREAAGEDMTGEIRPRMPGGSDF